MRMAYVGRKKNHLPDAGWPVDNAVLGELHEAPNPSQQALQIHRHLCDYAEER